MEHLQQHLWCRFVALHLESVPGATSREVKRFLDEQGSVHVGNDLFETVDPNTDDRYNNLLV